MVEGIIFLSPVIAAIPADAARLIRPVFLIVCANFFFFELLTCRNFLSQVRYSFSILFFVELEGDVGASRRSVMRHEV